MATVTLSSPAGRWTLISAILASSMAFIDGTALNVVLPALQKALNATGADLFWITWVPFAGLMALDRSSVTQV